MDYNKRCSRAIYEFTGTRFIKGKDLRLGIYCDCNAVMRVDIAIIILFS